MNDDLLFKLSLTTTCLGILALFIISTSIQLPIISPSHVNETKDNMKFIITGIVENIRETDKMASITIAENNIINVNSIYFKSNNASTNIHKGDIVKLQAMRYKDSIIINKID